MKLTNITKELLSTIQSISILTKYESIFLQKIELQENYDFIQKTKLNIIRDKYHSELKEKYYLKQFKEKVRRDDNNFTSTQIGIVRGIDTTYSLKGLLKIGESLQYPSSHKITLKGNQHTNFILNNDFHY